MNIRQLREIFFKSCRPQPVLAAIIEYLSQLDIRFDILSREVDSIDVSDLKDEIEDVAEGLAGVELRIDESIVPDIKSIDDDLTDNVKPAIIDNANAIYTINTTEIPNIFTHIDLLKKRMQGIYIRFGALSATEETVATPTASPYEVALPISGSKSRIYDDGAFQIISNNDEQHIKFMKAGRIEITFSLWFNSSAASNGCAIHTANSTGSGSRLAFFAATTRNPLLHFVADVEAGTEYWFFGKAGSTSRTIYLNSISSFAQIRYIDREDF